MSSEKSDLTRAGTIELTAQDGKLFLDKNLTDWKKPYLMSQFDNDTPEDKTEEEPTESKSPKKLKLSKHTTMKGTAKEAVALLASGGPDKDVFTRGQQKTLTAIKNEKPVAKKAKLARDSTMVATAKEGQALIGKGKLGGTRQKKKTAVKRSSSIAIVVAEAKQICGSINTSSTRKLRKQSGKPPALKKAGTMENTAKEGKEFLSRKRKRSRK